MASTTPPKGFQFESPQLFNDPSFGDFTVLSNLGQPDRAWSGLENVALEAIPTTGTGDGTGTGGGIGSTDPGGGAFGTPGTGGTDTGGGGTDGTGIGTPGGPLTGGGTGIGTQGQSFGLAGQTFVDPFPNETAPPGPQATTPGVSAALGQQMADQLAQMGIVLTEQEIAALTNQLDLTNQPTPISMQEVMAQVEAQALAEADAQRAAESQMFGHEQQMSPEVARSAEGKVAQDVAHPNVQDLAELGPAAQAIGLAIANALGTTFSQAMAMLGQFSPQTLADLQEIAEAMGINTNTAATAITETPDAQSVSNAVAQAIADESTSTGITGVDPATGISVTDTGEGISGAVSDTGGDSSGDSGGDGGGGGP